ncbi:MAG: hypothetical protein ABIH34_04230 [Nanoarchaeota archaeon]
MDHFSKKLSGRDSHPILSKNDIVMKVKEMLPGERFQSITPTPFVGRYGYPEVNVGLLAPPLPVDNVWEYDAPLHWSAKNTPILKIVEYRSSLINSRFKADVRSRDKMLALSQQVGLSSIPVDIDITLRRAPTFHAAFDSIALPVGPSAELKKVTLSSNPKIPHKVESVVNDDLKAEQQIHTLSQKGFDEHYLSRILSIGVLGMEKTQKLVPTRWSITATDDMLGKRIHKEILDHPEADCQAFSGGYMGNHYLIILMPGLWSYELFEMYAPRTKWNKSQIINYMTDQEPVRGRKNYADNTAGGYYAARLAILEKLKAMKRRARVLALRFITDEYTNPLGVWVVREATRKTMQEKPLHFAENKLAIRYAESFAMKKFGANISEILEKSILLNQPEQKGLLSFS